jgi:hypothetical protein
MGREHVNQALRNMAGTNQGGDVERTLLVEMTVITNIDSVSGMRSLLRSGLDGVLMHDMVKGQIREIEIIDVQGIDTNPRCKTDEKISPHTKDCY